jgi:hypothetical protein
MTQNSAPEIGSTGIVDAPIGGREIPLDQFTNPEYASQPHNKAFTFLEGSFLDPDLEDQDRPALNKEENETPEQYEERLLKGVEEALQPNVDDTISPEGAWARSKLLTMGQDGPDMKDLAMAVDARRVLRQQAEWQKQRDALHRRITRERYVAEHVFSEDDGLETTSGKLKSLTEAGSAGMEKARESILLDRIAHEIARNALMSVPDNAIVELPELRGVKGVPAVRDFLRTIAHDVALSGKDISYESVRAEIQRRMEDRDPSTSELKISVNSPASKELLTARSMLDAQFNKTMIAAMQRVRGMRGAADMASAPSEAFGDTNPSVMRAVEVLKNIPRNQDGIQQLMQEQGILARALEQFGSPRRYTRVDHEKRDDKDPGYELVSESDEEYISRNRDSLSRLTQQLALNFNDYALNGTCSGCNSRSFTRTFY